MANKNAKVAGNMAGKYYVDKSCIYCGQCHEIAPDFFADDENGSYMRVIKQPTNANETNLCEDALHICPVSAIGNDGE